VSRTRWIGSLKRHRQTLAHIWLFRKRNREKIDAGVSEKFRPRARRPKPPSRAASAAVRHACLALRILAPGIQASIIVTCRPWMHGSSPCMTKLRAQRLFLGVALLRRRRRRRTRACSGRNGPSGHDDSKQVDIGRKATRATPLDQSPRVGPVGRSLTIPCTREARRADNETRQSCTGEGTIDHG
jgi:hypothetical protein